VPNVMWIYWITIPLAIIMVSLVIWAIKSTKPLVVETKTEIIGRSEHPTDTLTKMHQRMIELKKVRLSHNINLKQFESVLPTLMYKLGLIELGKWDDTEKSIRKRIKRAVGKNRKGTRSAYFKAICEASRIKREWLQSQNWTIQDGLKIGEWLDGYNWGLRELRDNDTQWNELWESIKPYLLDSKLRELIEKHINLSYVYSSTLLVDDYSKKYPRSIRLLMLHETLVGSPINPVKVEFALSEVLAEIKEQMGMLGQGEKELPILSSNSSMRSPVTNKLKFVVQKITEAMQITPKGNDITVHLPQTFLYMVNIDELYNILLKFQNDDKILRIKYFPEYLLSTFPHKFTKETLDEHILDYADPNRRQFRVKTNKKRFDDFAKQLGAS